MSVFERQSVCRECLLGRHAERFLRFSLRRYFVCLDSQTSGVVRTESLTLRLAKTEDLSHEGVTIMDALSGLVDTIVALVNQLLGTVTGLLG